MWIFGTLVLLAAGVGAVLYKQLAQAQNLLDDAWGEVETQIGKRHGLVHSLVEMVKEHYKQETALFEGVIRAYNQCIEASALDEKGKAETELSQQLAGLFSFAESRPEFKTNRDFQKIKDDLSTIEKRLERVERSYNASANDFNQRLQSPGYGLLAKHFGFKREDFFNMEYVSQSPVTSEQ